MARRCVIVGEDFDRFIHRREQGYFEKEQFYELSKASSTKKFVEALSYSHPIKLFHGALKFHLDFQVLNTKDPLRTLNGHEWVVIIELIKNKGVLERRDVVKRTLFDDKAVFGKKKIFYDGTLSRAVENLERLGIIFIIKLSNGQILYCFDPEFVFKAMENYK